MSFQKTVAWPGFLPVDTTMGKNITDLASHYQMAPSGAKYSPNLMQPSQKWPLRDPICRLIFDQESSKKAYAMLLFSITVVLYSNELNKPVFKVV